MCPQASFNSVPITLGTRKRKPLKSIFADLKPPAKASAKHSSIDLFFRKKFFALLEQIEDGFVVIDDPIERIIFGQAHSDLHSRIVIDDIETYKKIALGGSNGSAQAYIDGLWSCDNPTSIIRILLRNREIIDAMESGLVNVAQAALKAWHALQRNSKTGSKKNIAVHYDLGNEFFRLFLDQRMMYSSAIYDSSDDSLNAASDRKLQRICDTLEINSNDHVVEIGSGWGGFACYAAAKTGCKVTTITISQEQFSEAEQQVKEQGLSEHVTVKLLDYRDIEGQFDKLVSIEMIEAVGHQYVDGYFKQIHDLLKHNGQALVQAIVIDDDRYEQALKEVDYIKRYIFPGSFIPCYSLIEETAANNNLRHQETHDMGMSYAQTLRDWREQFYKSNKQVDQQGYDASFKRMWEFYLCYCEGGFEERAISVGQILFQRSA